MNKKLLKLLAGIPEFKGLYAQASEKLPELLAIDAPTKPKKWFSVRNEDSEDGEPAEISIFDNIGYDYWSDSGTGAAEYAKALALIPESKPVNLLMNSPGGNLWDGLAIAAMNEARGNVTCIVLGVAASAASVIAVKCSKTIMAPSSTMMIHNAQSIAQGNQFEMKQAMECLATHDEVLANLYAAKSGKPAATFAAAMKATTWYTAEQAKAAGLCDEINSQTAPSNVFDFSGFKNVPKNLRPGATNKGEPHEFTMNKTQILALLKTWGVTPPDNATDEQLLTLVTAGKPTAATPPVNASEPDAPVTREELNALTAELTAMRQRDTTQRDNRITAAVDSAVSSLRIPTNHRDAWIARAKADEAVLDLIPSAPPERQGPVGMGVVATATRDVITAFEGCNAARDSLLRGNIVSVRDLRNEAMKKADLFIANESAIRQVMNTNTVPAELQRQVIMQIILRDFKRVIAPLGMFSTVFNGVKLEGTDKIEVPYFALNTTTPTAWNAGTGYVAGNTVVTKREISVTNRSYLGASFTSQEMARQPFLGVVQSMQLIAEQVAYYVWQQILSCVTAANFTATPISKAADAFGSEDVIDMQTAADTANWPVMARGILIAPGHNGNLQKDFGFKAAYAAAADYAVKNGRPYPNIYGFDWAPTNNIPSNSENLVGFSFFKSAILAAFSPIPPSEEVLRAGTTYEMVVDPDSGICLERRSFGSNNLDNANQFIESNYGFAPGVQTALQRVITP
jgi:ATP-dependent protease ClpP protease subunit